MTVSGLLALAAATLVVAPATITTQKTGNVFVAGEPVVVQVGGAEAGTTYRVLPYDGPAAKEGAVAGGTLDLGKLPRGYYTVEVGTGAEAVRAPVVVVPQPRARKTDHLSVDAAHSWLIPQARFADGAELLRLAGFHWARERLNWGEVEPKRGQFAWGRYDASANAAAAKGIHVYQIFHNSPGWARADGNGSRYPDDLRDAYRFTQAAARHYKGRVEAWEVWNEADISGFSVDGPADYAAFFKAAALGFKAGDPAVQVTQVSLAMQATRFHEGLYRNGTSDYLDIFNYHIYDTPANYVRRAEGHFDVMDRAGVHKAPVWLTEAGIPLRAVDGTLTEADKRRQAEFIPKSYAMSLASGTDRHFFFVFPHYLENGVEFGAMDAQMRPYPGYAALAAVTDLLGEAEYRGRHPIPGFDGIQIHRFGNGAGETLVIWSDRDEIVVGGLLYAGGQRAYNCVGAELTNWDGKVGPSPLFIVRDALPPQPNPFLAKRDPRKVGKRGTPSDVVIRVRLPQAKTIKMAENLIVGAGVEQAVEVQVYNFGAKARRVQVRLAAPSGWKLDRAEWSEQIEPMGRAVHETRLHVPAAAKQYGHVLSASGSVAGAAKPAPVCIDMAIDPDTMHASEVKDLQLNDASKWTANISGNGKMTCEPDPDGGARFHCTFQPAGDKWAYPLVSFAPPAEWSAYDAVEAEVAADRDDSESDLRFQVSEPGGTAYYTETGYPARTKWQRVVIPFSALGYGSFSPADPNGKLDLDKVEQFRFGVNTRATDITIRIRNVRLVAWDKR